MTEAPRVGGTHPSGAYPLSVPWVRKAVRSKSAGGINRGTRGVDPKVQDGGFSKSGTYSAALWGLVTAFVSAAWIVGIWAPAQWRVSGLLAATGCATSAMAATLQIRSYMIRLCGLVRAASGLEQADGAPVRSLR